MRRFIKWLRESPPPQFSPTDSYFEMLLKRIPGDIVAAYLVLDGIIKEQGGESMLYWIVFGSLLALTPFYVCYLKTVPPGITRSKFFPVAVSMVAFTVWVFALGGPFLASWPHWYRPVYGSIALIITTLAIPIIEKAIFGSE